MPDPAAAPVTTPAATATPAATTTPAAATPAPAAVTTPAAAVAPAAATPAAAPAAPAAAATEVKLELPKDSKLVQADIDRITATARDKGLSQEQATALLAERNDAVTSFEARMQEASKQQRTEWVKAINDDKDLGGEKLATTQRNSMRVIDTFMSPTLRTMLRDTGFGDHPEVVRFLNKIGLAMAEDTGTLPTGGSGDGKKSAENVLYGSS